MKIKIIPLVIALVAGLLAVVLISVYLQQKEKDLMSRRPQQVVQSANVVVAVKDILKGTVIKENMVDLVKVPENRLQSQAVMNLSRAIGKTARDNIGSGDQVLSSNLSYPDTELSLSMRIPPGKRAVAITGDAAASLGGGIKAGDKVDIITTIPIPSRTADGKSIFENGIFPLFQSVLVLSGDGAGKGGQAGSIILALTPQEATFVALLQEAGKLKLILRGPNDSQYEPVQPATMATLMRYVFGEQPPQAPTVEIYRGISKTKTEGAKSTAAKPTTEEVPAK